MSSRRRGLTAVHVLLLVALLEVVINRNAVPMLRPATGLPPWWYVGLDYVGLFLFYFTGTLAAIVLVQRCVAELRKDRGPRAWIAYGLVGVATLLAAIPLVVSVPPVLSISLEVAFGVAILALIIATFGRARDLGVQLGIIVVALPLLLHTATVIGGRFVWPGSTFDGQGVTLARAGVLGLAFAALLSPYVFAPRPFSRAVTRPAPVIIAMLLASAGAVLSRTMYAGVTKALALGLGIDVSQSAADPRLAMYLLAFATFAWTLASCLLADSVARRRIGVGLALIVLGGYGFQWPHHYLLPLLGLSLINAASRRVRDEELAALPLSSETPPIGDAAWALYVTAVAQGLKRTLTGVHSLTTRGEGGLTSSVIVGEIDGMPVRTRIERIDGSVLGLDVVLGREIDELRGATLTLWAIAPRALGINPAGPPAAPLLRSNDAQFDQRFKTRGSAQAFGKLFDDELRSRAVTTLEGWLAFWDSDGLRYRVYPGRGAPLDHPMPLSDLALGRPATADRLLAVIELLVDIAKRGVKVVPAEPAELADLEVHA